MSSGWRRDLAQPADYIVPAIKQAEKDKAAAGSSN
jgi:hypothetical protein